ncbi:TetR/AcrR family transcriptional regulator [Planococcus dechangensis]|uniref:TetR/AcrR family transcriptional regulator n=1 Tax=Planococcus dechangensis TaxID=1176255 RepID=A0ABV9MG29_9BACL
MKKNSAVAAQTKQNLTDAFWDIYCNKRIEKITIKEVTVKAGYNRSTFYEYFTDVYDVLEQLEDTLISKLQELPVQQLSSTDSAFSFEALINVYVQHSKYLAVLLGDHGDPAFQAKTKRSMKPLMKEVLLKQGAKDDFELDYTLEYALSAMIGVLSYWFNQEHAPPLENLMELLGRLSTEGVMKNPDGR